VAHQIITSAFRIQHQSGTNIPWNVFDQANASSGWTAGATLIESVARQAPLGQVYSVVGWSICCTPIFAAPDPDSSPFGKLGKIVGGLVHMSPTPTDPAKLGGAWVAPMIPLPDNTSGLATVWDGSSDPMIPASGPTIQATEFVPLTVAYSPPVPIELYPGDDIQIGLWITPSLSQNSIIAVTNASYSVVFDDGLPVQPGW
jgi:hypothetical protein